MKPCTLHLTDVPPSHPPVRKCQSSKRSEGRRRDPPRQHTRHQPGQGCHLSGFASGLPPAIPWDTPALSAHHPLLADRLKCACWQLPAPGSGTGAQHPVVVAHRVTVSVCTEGKNRLARPVERLGPFNAQISFSHVHSSWGANSSRGTLNVQLPAQLLLSSVICAFRRAVSPRNAGRR